MIDLLNLGNTYVKYYKLIFGQYFKLPFLLGGGGGKQKTKNPKQNKTRKKPQTCQNFCICFHHVGHYANIWLLWQALERKTFFVKWLLALMAELEA